MDNTNGLAEPDNQQPILGLVPVAEIKKAEQALYEAVQDGALDE